MTLEEQQAHHAANMEAAARYFEENVSDQAQLDDRNKHLNT